MLPAAIAIAVSPTGLIEMILVLLSARARVNALVFLSSVTVSVFALPLLGASILRAWADDTQTTADTVTGWLLIGLGAVLAALAVGSLADSNLQTPPVALDKIAAMGAGTVFLLSLTVVWLNPINAAVLLSVGSQAASIHVSTPALLASLAVFTIVATAPFIAVVAFLASGGQRATATLDRIKRWLVDHYRIVMTATLGLLAVLLVADGVAVLLD